MEFAKFHEWCDNTREETTKSIAEAASQIEQLTADIAKAEADAERLAGEIADLEEGIAAAESELKSATEVRDNEKSDYDATHADLSESIDAIERAISVLKTRQALSLSIFCRGRKHLSGRPHLPAGLSYSVGRCRDGGGMEVSSQAQHRLRFLHNLLPPPPTSSVLVPSLWPPHRFEEPRHKRRVAQPWSRTHASAIALSPLNHSCVELVAFSVARESPHGSRGALPFGRDCRSGHSAVGGDDLRHYAACPRLAMVASQRRRRAPVCCHAWNMRLACHALPLNRRDCTVSGVWHCVTYRLWLAARFQPRPLTLLQLQRDTILRSAILCDRRRGVVFCER